MNINEYDDYNDYLTNITENLLKERISKKESEIKRIQKGYNDALTFDYDKFITEYNRISMHLQEVQLNYNSVFNDNFLLQNEYVLCFSKENTIFDICRTKNLMTYLAKKYKKYNSSITFSYIDVKSDIFEEVFVKLHIDNDIIIPQGTVKFLNKIYIAETQISKYFKYIYEKTKYDFNKLVREYPIIKYGNGTICYSKQQIEHYMKLVL